MGRLHRFYKRRCWRFAFWGLLLVMLCRGGPAPAQTGPQAAVVKLNDALMDLMKTGPQVAFAKRFARIDPVVGEVFALTAIVRIATGKYWHGLTAPERERLISLHRRYTGCNYVSRFDDYSGQRFQVFSAEYAGDSRASVRCILEKSSGEPIEFIYKLVQHSGRWEILDIHVKGVSQLALTRVQFTTLLRQDGFDGLIQSLEAKIAALSPKQ